MLERVLFVVLSYLVLILVCIATGYTVVDAVLQGGWPVGFVVAVATSALVSGWLLKRVVRRDGGGE